MSAPEKPTVADLATAPEHKIRAILLTLCQDERIRDEALAHYAAVQRQEEMDRGTKRKAGDDVFVCINCQSPFTQEDNPEGSCVYHPEESSIDWQHDTWCDTDEWMDVDTKEMRDEFPQGFTWDCCDKRLNEPGCETAKHEADPELLKRRRELMESVKALEPSSHQNGRENEEIVDLTEETK